MLLSSPRFSTDPVKAFREAMVECNEQLHASSIEDGLSGTTAIACLVRGRTIYVANVGDSRYDNTVQSYFPEWMFYRPLTDQLKLKLC